MISVGSKRYFGSAVNYRNRVAQHISKLKKGKHENGILQNIVNKYGIDCLQFSILEIVKDKTKLLEIEQTYLDTAKSKLNREDQLNILWYARSRLGTPVSDKTKENIRKALKESTKRIGRPPTIKIPKEKKIRIYKPHTQETKDKIAQSKIGKPVIALQKPRKKRGIQSEQVRNNIKQGIQNSVKKIGRPCKNSKEIVFTPLFLI